jgi:hypothetical protein
MVKAFFSAAQMYDRRIFRKKGKRTTQLNGENNKILSVKRKREKKNGMKIHREYIKKKKFSFYFPVCSLEQKCGLFFAFCEGRKMMADIHKVSRRSINTRGGWI